MASLAGSASASSIELPAGGDLSEAVALASLRSRNPGPDDVGGITIRLAPGAYELAPHAFTDESCGNCEEPATAVPASYGVRVSGRGIRILGAPAHGSTIRTKAGYGIFFEDCEECSIDGVIVTGGVRDTSGLATDAAIVARRASVRIEDCWIRDNLGDSATVARTVVGIIGVAGREDSKLHLEGNRITRNSWDGIALYRGAQAVIVDNVIDGVDLAVGGRMGGGRGVGIGCTWNARAEIRGNYVTRYWKGIGIFVDAEAVVEANVVAHLATWGLSLWDAEKGHPVGRFRWNAVDSTGACGASIARTRDEGPNPGGFTENALCRTGQNPRYDTGTPYCLQSAIAVDAAPKRFAIEKNLLFQNREAGDQRGSGDLDESEFRRRLQPLLAELSRYRAPRESRFFREFGRTPEAPTAPPPHDKSKRRGSR